MNKKSFIVIFITILILIFLSIIGLVFFRDKDNKNAIIGDIKVAYTENNYSNSKMLNNIKTIIKDPTIRVSKNSAYVRLIVKFMDEKNLITDKKRLTLIKKCIYYDTSYLNNKKITSNLIENSSYTLDEINNLEKTNKIINLYNNNDFTLDKKRSTDNVLVFIYKNKLEDGKMATLFTNVLVPIDFTNSERKLLGDYNIKIDVEAIDSTMSKSLDEAMKSLNKVVD